MRLTPKIIREKLEREFETDLTSKTRKRTLVYQRTIAFKLCRVFTSYSLQEIGTEFKKDHATVMHSLAQFDIHKDSYYFVNYMKIYNRYKENFDKLKQSKGSLAFMSEIEEVNELKRAFIQEKLKIERDLNVYYSAKLSKLQKKIDIYEKHSFFDKMVTLPEDEFLELKERINAFLVMNGMNYQRRIKRLKKQLEC